MGKNKEKMVIEEIADMEQDFPRWYTDVVKKADLIDYSSIKGFTVMRPYGTAVWENIKNTLDGMLKETGHENVLMPLLIPESLLEKEKNHVEGFAPEVAWVTHGGEERLQERLCIRPTSEALFCEHYANRIQSYRDLPVLFNQWCNIVRWEKETRPFLRGREFFWQEGHTVHETKEEAMKETLDILDLYGKLCEEYLAMPVLKGRKTEKEKFAGAEATYTIESLMHDGQALQAGTTHYFGDGFARAFGIQYTDRDNSLKHPFQTSWGVTTRLIGGLIMVHGDNHGLVMPPKIAPIQVIVIPVAQHKEGVLEKARELTDEISKSFRTKIDESDKKPGWKYSEYEVKGVPVRIEIGPRDIENNQAVLARRDTREKTVISLDNITEEIEKALSDIHNSIYEKALKHREEMTSEARDFDEFAKIVKEKGGFIKAMWCGDENCELEIKEKTTATSRCISFDDEKISDKCVCCGELADKLVYWGKAY